MCLCSGCSPLFISTCSRWLKGIVFLAEKKRVHGAYLLPSYHQTVKKHLLRLNLLHICVLIIDSLLYCQQNATKITVRCAADGIKPSLRFDRLSHLITTLKHWEDVERGGEYALDSCTSKGVSVLNIFKACCLENIILYFFRLVETQGLSEIAVTTDFKQQTLRFKRKKKVYVWNFEYKPHGVHI